MAVVLGTSATPAGATEYSVTFYLDADQAESANPGASGFGQGTITYDTSSNLLSWDISWSGTQQPVNTAHFHGPAAPGVGAGIQVSISDITSPSVGSDTLSAAQETQLLDGLWYANFHTSHSPSGEIRGQVVHPGAGVGGVAELPEGEFAPLEFTETSSGMGAGTIAAIAIGIAVVAGGLAAAGWFGFGRKLLTR